MHKPRIPPVDPAPASITLAGSAADEATLSAPTSTTIAPVCKDHQSREPQATTSSLEALKAYSAGRSAIFAQGGPASIPHFQRAIAIDPQFAMAYGDLSITYWNMGQTDRTKLTREQIESVREDTYRKLPPD